MIAVLKPGVTDKQIESLKQWLEGQNLDVHVSKGKYQTVIGLIGDTDKVDAELLESLEMVESVKRISEPFKSANRKFHPDDTVIKIGNTEIGGDVLTVIAGPCSIESEEQLTEIARKVKNSGATVLRGGAFKPRTSPYDFQGLKGEGIRILLEAKKATGLPVVTEIMNVNHIDLFSEVDILQVGARNMQNFELLKELGRCGKPILLKRGMAATLKELLMSAEYIMAGGNNNIILCERGIRSFDSYTRNVLDLSAVPVLKELTHLPVIVDPSHATGISRLVEPMAVAAVACGASGVMIEVHNNPSCALCDGAQSVTPEQFDKIAEKMRKVKEALK